MIILGFVLVMFSLWANIWFYEYRVGKGPANPKELSLVGWSQSGYPLPEKGTNK